MTLQIEAEAPDRPNRQLSAADNDDRPAASLPDVLRLRPGWPLVLLFVGYPLWWVLGIADLVGFVAAGAMAYELLRMRTIRVPAGLGVWLLFLAWVILGVALVQVDAPGAVAGASATRYLTWSWRLAWYLKATIVLLYIGNMRRQLSLQWVCRVFSWMFVVIVAGGLLGVVAPNFEFRSLLELILPQHISAIPFIHAEIHPVASEGFAVFSASQGRTSAPFPYANVWGLNFACFLPFFIVGWLGRGAGWRRAAGPFVLAIATVPVIYSLNRGLWLALAGAAAFIAVRSALAGRGRLLAALIVGLALVAAIVALSPLGQKVNDRLHGAGPTSDTGRENLSSLTVSSMVQTSPLLGFGTTRDVQGNFNSINGGATTSCPRCSLPALGTQGQFLLVGFAQGIGGVVIYFGFLILQFLRYIRLRSGLAIGALSLLLMHFITSTVYSADNLALFAIFGALALLWRARYEEVSEGRHTPLYARTEPTVARYLTILARHRRSLAVLAILGALCGGFVAHSAGRTYAATVSLFVPVDPSYPGQNRLPPTLDTIAQYATSDAAAEAMQRAVGTGSQVAASSLSVIATANTRLLHLTYAADSSATARDVVTAAAQSVLSQRARAQLQRKHQAVAVLDDRAQAIATALQSVLEIADTPRAGRPLAPLVGQLRAAADQVTSQLTEVQQLPTSVGMITSAVTIRSVWDRWKIDVTTGLALALLCWSGVVLVGLARGPRLRYRRYSTISRDVRLLVAGPPESLDAEALLILENPSACVAVGTSSDAVVVATDLDSRIHASDRTGPASRVILVAAARDRAGNVARARRHLERLGVEVAGLVIVDSAAEARRV